MKFIKYIALGALVTLGVFFAALYTTSCTKDACRTVTCVNGGSCGGGLCTCPAGIGGTNCQTVYRASYTNTYVGNTMYNSTSNNPGYVPHIDSSNSLVFLAGNDSNFNKMQLVWNRFVGKQVTMNITLSNSSSSGSDFTVAGFSIDTFAYTGTGTVNGTSASLILKETHPNSPSVTISLNNFIRQ